ncbi:MAG: hypothetical protein NTZ17_01620 [Phycisphaerae bacterium]|nr:hypothetical protein [Phycisphaerae bacterium]
MHARRYNLANILAVGVLTTVLLLTGLFWARSLCGALRHNWLFQAVPEVRVSLSPLLPWKQDGDPNLVSPYLVTARPVADAPLAVGLGVAQYVLSRMPAGPESHVYRWILEPDPDGEWIYFDPALGQIVCQGTNKVTSADGRMTLSHFTYYAGPEGVAVAPDEKLGRFVDPIVDRSRLRPWIVYDRGSARFFAVDWSKQMVKKGRELPKDGAYHPVQIGRLEKNTEALRTRFVPGAVRNATQDGPGRESSPNIMVDPMLTTNSTPVLDASRRVDLLSVDTLELTTSRMRLPAAACLYAEQRAVTPREVAAYSVQTVALYSSQGKTGIWSSLGCVAAALSRDTTSVRLEVFDPNGRVVASDETKVPQYLWTHSGGMARQTPISSPEAAYFRLPGAYGLTLAKLALESLHPPVFLLLSYFPASQFEATAGYRSLLLLPDSFVAMKARDKQGHPIEEFFVSMVFAIPAFVLALLLAWRVDRDGSRLGLSKDARTAWIVGTVVLGLPAYLTYRLTRPKVTLVTCANCGVGRRPDRDKCHRCGSSWAVPELTPPAWRVLGAPEPAEESSFSREPQADSQVQ